MKILLTGGTGAVGRQTTEYLVNKGHQVTVIGRRAGMEVPPGAEYRVCDINDYDALYAVMAGMEAVVHLAAIPNPLMEPDEELFASTPRARSTSMRRRRSAASSAWRRPARSTPWGIIMRRAFDLSYFPIDERTRSSPRIPTPSPSRSSSRSPIYYWRRAGISGVSLRLPAVYVVKPSCPLAAPHGRRRAYDELRRLAALPWTSAMSLRDLHRPSRQAMYAMSAERIAARREGREEPPRRWPRDMSFAVVSGMANFWTSLDARDAGQAFEKGVLADYKGSHPLFINDSINTLGAESEALLAAFFPRVKPRTRVLKGAECIVSISAPRPVGFEPVYHGID
jgi:hypothetical protein